MSKIYFFLSYHNPSFAGQTILILCSLMVQGISCRILETIVRAIFEKNEKIFQILVKVSKIYSFFVQILVLRDIMDVLTNCTLLVRF